MGVRRSARGGMRGVNDDDSEWRRFRWELLHQEVPPEGVGEALWWRVRDHLWTHRKEAYGLCACRAPWPCHTFNYWYAMWLSIERKTGDSQ